MTVSFFKSLTKKLLNIKKISIKKREEIDIKIQTDGSTKLEEFSCSDISNGKRTGEEIRGNNRKRKKDKHVETNKDEIQEHKQKVDFSLREYQKNHKDVCIRLIKFEALSDRDNTFVYADKEVDNVFYEDDSFQHESNNEMNTKKDLINQHKDSHSSLYEQENVFKHSCVSEKNADQDANKNFNKNANKNEYENNKENVDLMPYKNDKEIICDSPDCNKIVVLDDTCTMEFNCNCNKCRNYSTPVKLSGNLPQTADVTPRMISLYKNLANRGEVALLPIEWQLDFLSLPLTLFYTFNDTQHNIESILTPISSLSYSSYHLQFRGIQAFKKLLSIGTKVRDAKEFHNSRKLSENYIMQGIKEFCFWAERDMKSIGCAASLRGTLVLKSSLDFLSKKHNKEKKNAFVDKLFTLEVERAMRVLALQKAGSFSTIHAIAITESFVVLAVLSSSNMFNPIRTLLVLDFFDRSQDVWNSIAIALLVMSARNEAIGLEI